MAQLALLAQNGGDIAAWFGGLAILWIVLAVAALVVWVWALIDAIQNPALDSTTRIVWILVIVNGRCSPSPATHALICPSNANNCSHAAP